MATPQQLAAVKRGSSGGCLYSTTLEQYDGYVCCSGIIAGGGMPLVKCMNHVIVLCTDFSAVQ